jgi:hypothetical protein
MVTRPELGDHVRRITVHNRLFNTRSEATDPFPQDEDETDAEYLKEIKSILNPHTGNVLCEFLDLSEITGTQARDGIIAYIICAAKKLQSFKCYGCRISWGENTTCDLALLQKVPGALERLQELVFRSGLSPTFLQSRSVGIPLTSNLTTIFVESFTNVRLVRQPSTKITTNYQLRTLQIVDALDPAVTLEDALLAAPFKSLTTLDIVEHAFSDTDGAARQRMIEKIPEHFPRLQELRWDCRSKLIRLSNHPLIGLKSLQCLRKCEALRTLTLHRDMVYDSNSDDIISTKLADFLPAKLEEMCLSGVRMKTLEHIAHKYTAVHPVAHMLKGLPEELEYLAIAVTLVKRPWDPEPVAKLPGMRHDLRAIRDGAAHGGIAFEIWLRKTWKAHVPPDELLELEEVVELEIGTYHGDRTLA